MSRYTKKPYIEIVLSELSGENKAILLNFINGKNADGTADISYTPCVDVDALLACSAGVTPVAYKYANDIVWKGYVIKTTSYLAFITFQNSIDLELGYNYSINANKHLVQEERVSSDYIRALLREDYYIDPTEDSPELPTYNNSNSGQVLTVGPTSAQGPSLKWENPTRFTKLYKHQITITVDTVVPQNWVSIVFITDYQSAIKQSTMYSAVQNCISCKLLSGALITDLSINSNTNILTLYVATTSIDAHMHSGKTVTNFSDSVTPM